MRSNIEPEAVFETSAPQARRNTRGVLYFRYALVLAMIDDEKAWVTGTRRVDSRDYLTVRTVAGDVFEIERPDISEELEALLMNEVRAIVADEDMDN